MPTPCTGTGACLGRRLHADSSAPSGQQAACGCGRKAVRLGHRLISGLWLWAVVPVGFGPALTAEALLAPERHDAPVKLAERTRAWTNRGPDDNTIHVVGNGQVVALAAGPDLSCLFGPPYTSPNLLQMSVASSSLLTNRCRREIGAAIWRHELVIEERRALRFTEFAAAAEPAYVRQFECTAPGVSWVIRSHASGGFKPSGDIPAAWVQCVRPGQPIYRDSKITDQWCWTWIVPRGSCTTELNERGELTMRLEPGFGSLVIVGANDYPAGVLATERVLREGAGSLLSGTRRFWEEFTRRRLKAKPLPPNVPSDCAEVLDGIAVLLKAQQAAQGPTIIGWHAPMAYIRDLYGGARGMLALGLFEEARASLQFRFQKFQRFGDLRTAEFIGTDCARHTYNDEVEGPAYVILQARDYLRATRDGATVKQLWPMLAWCWSAQKRQLARGLLPFNGDETYIPYGLFPIEGELQGSADTTLAFVASGEWLIEWAQRQGFWAREQCELERRLVQDSRAAYRRWFVDRDRIWANAPEREQWIDPPRFRHNACQGCRAVVTWIERSPNGRYLCPDCFGKSFPPPLSPGRLTLNSVSLLPDYLGVDILTAAERHAVAERILARARPNGSIPTATAEDIGAESANRVVGAAGGGVAGRLGDLCVGYDPGLLLLTLSRLNHAAAPVAYRRMLRMVDSAGAWNEYYDGEDRPVSRSIRANVWASGINAAVLLEYLSRRESSGTERSAKPVERSNRNRHDSK